MADYKAFLALALTLTTLGACSWISEETQFALHRDWERFKGFDYADATARLTGFREAFPSPRQKELEAEKEICLNSNGERRVTVQDGVSDKVEYRRCALAPYATDMGQRMGRRPDW